MLVKVSNEDAKGGKTHLTRYLKSWCDAASRAVGALWDLVGIQTDGNDSRRKKIPVSANLIHVDAY